MTCWYLPLVLFCSAVGFAEASKTPDENLDQKNRPQIVNGDELSKRLLAGTAADNPESIADLFFPAEPFLILKDVPHPGDYHKQLVKEYFGDIHKLHHKFKSSPALDFVSFKPGFCKWKAVGSEYNKIAYWSCYRSKITARYGQKTETIEIKTLINWGKDWFITHLGGKSH